MIDQNNTVHLIENAWKSKTKAVCGRESQTQGKTRGRNYAYSEINCPDCKEWEKHNHPTSDN